MDIKINYSGQCIPIPAEPVLARIDQADGTKLRVLLCILAAPDISEADLCDKLNITKKSLTDAIRFWQEAGVFEGAVAPKAPIREKKEAERITVVRPRTLARAAELPRYSTDEVADYLEAHKEVNELLTSCQQYMGKMFNVSEVETVIGLLDYLHLDSAYILLLFSHCQKMGKKSLRYVEKLAIGLFDDGIMDYEELDRHLREIEAAAGMEKQLRHLFGAGRRALTSKEKETFARWAGTWKMPFELIERAYEITVENTGGASLPYCNAVLEKWYQSGYTTLEQVESAMAQYRHDRDGVKDQKGSFETNDFFEAALRRSYGSEEG